MSLRYLYLLICGIVLAGIIHIVIILLIPDYGSRDAWQVISAKSDPWVFRPLPNSGDKPGGLEDTDPYIQMGACTFDLDQAGLRLSGATSKLFWSVSIFDQYGTVMYSLNNRTAVENRLDLVVLNPVQMIQLREAPPKDIERSIVIEADIDKGFVVLRQFQMDESDHLAVSEFIGKAHCEQFTP